MKCQARVFKTKWFEKAARKANIKDEALYAAITDAELGKIVDLGGGVFKKRLLKNKYRAIILIKQESHWIYEYLFAKKDRENIDSNELTQFRKLAEAYTELTEQQLNKLILDGHLVEIKHEN